MWGSTYFDDRDIEEDVSNHLNNGSLVFSVSEYGRCSIFYLHHSHICKLFVLCPYLLYPQGPEWGVGRRQREASSAPTPSALVQPGAERGACCGPSLDPAAHHPTGNRHTGTAGTLKWSFSSLWWHDCALNTFLYLSGLCELQLRCWCGPLPSPTCPRQFITSGEPSAGLHWIFGWHLSDLKHKQPQPMSRWTSLVSNPNNTHHSSLLTSPEEWIPVLRHFCKGNRGGPGPKEQWRQKTGMLLALFLGQTAVTVFTGPLILYIFYFHVYRALGGMYVIFKTFQILWHYEPSVAQ